MLNSNQFGNDYEQLPMFVTAKDLMENYAHSEAEHSGGQITTGWANMKLDEAKGSGLYEDIKKYGIEQPLNVEHTRNRKEMLNGHHRMSAAYAINPDMLVPVNHTESIFENAGKETAGYRQRRIERQLAKEERRRNA